VEHLRLPYLNVHVNCVALGFFGKEHVVSLFYSEEHTSSFDIISFKLPFSICGYVFIQGAVWVSKRI